ncbi:putative d-serine dehydratase [Bacillus pseudomycoides]|nr:putative d-serine dehydratase [Bacillus pseudomycoides]
MLLLNFEAGVLLPANSGIKKVIGIQLPITPSEKHSSSILLLNPMTRKQTQAPLYTQLNFHSYAQNQLPLWLKQTN